MYAHARQIDNTAPTTNVEQGHITEIIQHNEQIPLDALLLPMIAQLSHQGRWLALIAPPASFDRDALVAAGAVLEHLWILRPDAQHSTESLAERALLAETCHTVISWHPQLEDDSLQRLHRAASGRDVQGILVRRR